MAILSPFLRLVFITFSFYQVSFLYQMSYEHDMKLMDFWRVGGPLESGGTLGEWGDPWRVWGLLES